MTTYVATATGNWSTMTWSPPGTPGVGDTVDCAGYTVTIDQDVNLGSGSLVATNAGAGGFTVATARSITANVTATVRPGTLKVTHATGTVTIVGTVTGGGSGAYCVYDTSVATLVITGSIVGGSGDVGVLFSSAGGTLRFTGSITGGTGSVGLWIGGTGEAVITGTVAGGNGASAWGINNTSTCTVTVSGAVVGGSGAIAVRNNATGTVTLSSTVTGGTGASAYGAANNAGGSLTVTEAIGNAYGPGSAVANSAPGVYGSATAGAVTRVYKATSGAYGQYPVAGAVKILSDATNKHTWRETAGGATLIELVP